MPVTIKKSQLMYKNPSTGEYVRTEVKEELKPLPVGISDYIRAQSEYYYVDKTLLIRDFLDKKASLLTGR